MANGRTEKPDGARYRQEDLQRRRQLQRRNRSRARRRRLIALGCALVAVAATISVASLAGSSDKGSSDFTRIESERATAGVRGGGEAAGLVRNATPQSGWRQHRGPVPILEYHVLGTAPAEAPYPELFVTRPDFSRQLGWLDRNGYQAVTLEQVEEAWQRDGALPAKPVVISFDDGYRPQFTFAMPQLRKHGWAGVLNMKAEGSDLYPSDVRTMIGAGWELASHTIDHADLTMLDPAALRREVAGSRQILRREYGVPVANFCYPAGRFDPTVIAAVRAAGYAGAATEIPGEASSAVPYELSRYEIFGSSGVSGLAADLAGS